MGQKLDLTKSLKSLYGTLAEDVVSVDVPAIN